MIAEPVNDRACLLALSQRASEATERPDVRSLAGAVGDTRTLARWLRQLPQRDDDGTSQGADSVTCDVPQRARIAPPDPNCVERSMTFIAVAEVIDPGPVRQLATVDLAGYGRHTFPVEDDRPIILDPAITRNALAAALYRVRNAGREDAMLSNWSPATTLQWIIYVAEGEAKSDAERGAVARTRVAFESVLSGQPLAPGFSRDIGRTLALAERAAPLWDGNAPRAISVAARALQLAAASTGIRNLSFRFGKYRIKPDWAKIRRLGATAGPAAVYIAAVSGGMPPQSAGLLSQLVAETFSESTPPTQTPVRRPDRS